MNNIFDIAILGAGPAGYVAAIRAAQLGLKVIIIEKVHLGGICLNWGCIPTKALLKAAEVYHTIAHASVFGIECKEINVNFEKLIGRSRSVSKQLSDGIKHLLKKNNVTHIVGTGSITSNKSINVKLESGETEEVRAKNIIIATGARPKILPNLPIDGDLIWNYKHAMTPKKLPKSVLVVGSGAIGIEFTSFYNMLGSKVSVIEVADRILIAEDKEIADFAHTAFQKRGMEIFVSAKISNIKKNKDSVSVEWSAQNKTFKQDFDHIISAVGVTPNVEDIGLENTKVTLENGHIKTNQYMQAEDANIFAIGDVTAPPLLAHKASHEGIICVEYIAGKKPEALDRKKIPGCTYCYPQIASIGYTEQQARDLKFDIKVGKFPLIANGKALAVSEPDGMVKVIFDAKTGELLGGHMIGHEVTEMIHSLTLARTLESTEEEIMHTIFPHPTISEAIHEAVLSAYNRAIHY